MTATQSKTDTDDAGMTKLVAECASKYHTNIDKAPTLLQFGKHLDKPENFCECFYINQILLKFIV